MEKGASVSPLLGTCYALFLFGYPREYFYHFPFLEIHSRKHYRLFQRDVRFKLQILFSTFDESICKKIRLKYLMNIYFRVKHQNYNLLLSIQPKSKKPDNCWLFDISSISRYLLRRIEQG